MKIFYFTGTGNSLAVAKRLSGELVSIPQVMKERSFVFEDEAIGIIFPLYCFNPPKMVREFLSKAKFNTDYLFAVATYGNLAGASMQDLDFFKGGALIFLPRKKAAEAALCIIRVQSHIGKHLLLLFLDRKFPRSFHNVRGNHYQLLPVGSLCMLH